MITEESLGYAFFCRKVLEVLSLDLSRYRPEQMERRLRGFLGRHPGETFYSLGRRLERDGAFAGEVRDFLTINVSEFFRNPERYQDLERRILPSLAGSGPLRVWSAGCSIGAEPYSLAILLAERRAAAGEVWATDVDPGALAQARRGVYREQDVSSVGQERLRRHFEATAEGYSVRPEVRRLVRFQQHDLLRDPFPAPWDLIVCRNVVIYFTEPARMDLYRRFAEVLRPGGVLFVGSTESILGARDLGFDLVAPFFYRRSSQGRE
jgi:chemotaxis protein methyltransferase CheR